MDREVHNAKALSEEEGVELLMDSEECRSHQP